MITFTRVLCPVDFSAFSRHALDHAVAFNRWYGASLHALHVVPTFTPLPVGDAGLYPPLVFTPADFAQFTRELRAFVEESAGAMPFEADVTEGNAVNEIVRRATELPADLVVMGTHGRSGFERLVLGSITERVLVKAPCPVLTVPRRVADAVPAGPVLFRNILCAVDFSPASLKALDYARSLAAQSGAALTVVTVVEHTPMFDPVMMGGPGLPAGAADATRAAEARLAELLGQTAHAPQPLVVEGKAYIEILRVAAARHADLVVLGAHAGGAGLIGFGSTTNQVVRRAECPVLTLKP